MKLYKCFLAEGNRIVISPINNNQHYYKEVNEFLKKGYRQIILNSDVLLNILMKYVLTNNARIISIELMEEDDSYPDSINRLIDISNEDSKQFITLYLELKDLVCDSVEIKSVHFKYRDAQSKLHELSISINGLVTDFQSNLNGDWQIWLENTVKENISELI